MAAAAAAGVTCHLCLTTADEVTTRTLPVLQTHAVGQIDILTDKQAAILNRQAGGLSGK